MFELQQIKVDIEKEAGIILQQNWQPEFIEYINHLLDTNFEKLIFLLYRIDVDEAKIKALLHIKSNENAGEIIAQAIIERQLQKIESRKNHQQQNPIAEDEKW